ncbi:MAG: hypothetical protein KDD66_03465 [Bdellovibrionales bacterium]|nr:hypothetical protein [Bdellovibrionales bacterium]
MSDDRITKLTESVSNLQSKIDGRFDLVQDLLVRTLSSFDSLPSDILSHSLTVFFEKTGRERKPYTIFFDGLFRASKNISVMRASILLVLLCDLAERLASKAGISRRHELIEELYSSLSKDSKNVAESVRSALYRFAYNQEGPFVKDGSFELRYNPDLLTLDLFQQGELVKPGKVYLELNSEDPILASALEKTLNLTPLGRLRQQRALLTPSSPEGAQQLMLEMYEGMETMVVHSVYYRPPSSLFPERLFNKLNLPDLAKRRAQIFRNALQNEAIEFHDIINIEELNRIVEKDEESRFLLFPEGVSSEHISELLDEMIYLITNFPGFNYYITRATFPFYVVTYAAKTRHGPEKITLFFRHFSPHNPMDVSCFAIRDPFVYQVIVANIAQWLISHPTTTSDRDRVVTTLSELKARL